MPARRSPGRCALSQDATECGIVKLPRAGGRQHPRRGDAQVPQPVGTYRKAHAEEGTRQGEDARSTQHPGRAPNGAGSSVRPLREDIRTVAAGRHQSPTVLHRRLQQHLHVQARVRLHLGFHRENDDGSTTLENGRLELFRNFETRQRARSTRERSDRQRAAESGVPDKAPRPPPTKSTVSAARSSNARDRRQAENLTDQTAPRSRTPSAGRSPGRIDPLRRFSMLTEGWDANTRTHVLSVRALEPVAQRAGHHGNAPVLRPQRRTSSAFNTPTCSASRLTSAKPVVAPPSRPVRPCR